MLFLTCLRDTFPVMTISTGNLGVPLKIGSAVLGFAYQVPMTPSMKAAIPNTSSTNTPFIMKSLNG